MTEKTFPFREIKKRDGRIVEFCPEKITQAIFKAAKAVGGENYQLAENLTRDVILLLSQQAIPGLNPTVEEIQDVVEKVLIEKGHARTAKAYILYRDKRTRIREAKSELMDVVKDILLENSLEQELGNGNSPTQKLHQIAISASQAYYLDSLLPEELANAHRDGLLHIHDLGYYSKTVDSFLLDVSEKMKLVHGRVEHPVSVTGELFECLFDLAGLIQKGSKDIYGELSLPQFDSAVGGIIGGFNHKLNRGDIHHALSRFVSYLCHSASSGVDPVLKCSMQIGLDTSEEGREVALAILQNYQGSNLPVYSWPRLLFLIKQDVHLSGRALNEDILKAALKAAVQHNTIALVFLDNATENHDCSVPPGYLSNGLHILENQHGPPGGPGRGNIATVTLNLPRLAMTTKDKAVFFIELDRLLRMGIRQLLHRFEVLAVLKRRDLPFIMGENKYLGSGGLKASDPIEGALKNGVLTMNFTGMPETVRVLLGEDSRNHDEVLNMVKEIASHMRRRVDMFAREFELNIVLSGAISSPHLRYFTENDRRDFGMIRGVTDRSLYSPSFFLFQEDNNLHQTMEIESVLHKACSAGYSSRLFLLPGSEPVGLDGLLSQLKEAGLRHVMIHTLSKGMIQ